MVLFKLYVEQAAGNNVKGMRGGLLFLQAEAIF